GIGGNYILHEYQERSKEKELELDDHKELVKRQEESAINAFQLLGEAHYSAIALNKLAQSAPPPGLTQAQIDLHQKNNELIWSRSSDFLERWEKEKTPTGMRLFYFYEGDRVLTAWVRVKEAGDQMLKAALNRVLMRMASPGAPLPRTSPQGEAQEEQKFDDAVNDLCRVLEQAHRANK
ncbi:MAG TPA: hypothetical protein VNN25_06860, partial [Thermoanaerobaculia bacterium]|nr:hypothetical protein [Thermoanaerobaculia bacterium]